MSIVSEGYFNLISDKIFSFHGIKRFGQLVQPQHEQCQNRSAVIFALEIVLHQHREKYKTPWDPLVGRRALEHLLLQKYKWPIKEIRELKLYDIILSLHEELSPNNLPAEAINLLRYSGCLHSSEFFTEIDDAEWDPVLYLTIQ